MASLEVDGVSDRVAIDRGASDSGVDESHIHVRQPGLPGDRPFGLGHRFALDRPDERLQLTVTDESIGLLALLADARGEAFHELPADADDHLARPKAGH